MKPASFLFIFLICLFSAKAQTNTDSLINVLNTQNLTKKEQINIHKEICAAFRYTDLEKTKLYVEKGLTLAIKEKDYDAAFNFCNYCRTAYLTVQDYDSALIYCEKALEWALLSQNQYSIANAYNTLGAINMDINNLTTALEYLLKGLASAEKIDNKEMIAMTMCNIASIYRGLNQVDTSLEYMLKTDSLAKEINHYGIQAIANSEICLLNINKNEYEKALFHAQKALDISRNNNLVNYEINSLHTITTIYRLLEEYDTAEKYADQCLQIIEEQNNPQFIIFLRDTWIEMSAINFEQKRYKESEAAAMKAWAIDSSTIGADFIASLLTTSNIFLGNKEKAFYFFEKFAQLKGEIFEENLHDSTIEMKIKYETEKKELRIATLEKERKLYIWLGITGVVVLLMAMTILFFSRRITLQKRKIAEQQINRLKQEKQLIATQSALDGETAERSRLARDLHDGLGGMLSVVKLNLKNMTGYSIIDNPDVERYNNALDLLDQSIGELRRVAHHLMPESLTHYGLKVSLEDFCRAIPGANFLYLGENARLNSHLEILIYRCAYELVNNAVKYANASNINLQLMIDDGVVALTVQDNGIGFDSEAITSGTGLKNIRARLSSYDGKMIIHSSQGNGTEVCIEIERQI